jgi:hypothetical protein
MNSLIDDVARVLATPMSRRQAFARIAGILGGVLLASVPAQAVGRCATCTISPDNCNSGLTCMNCGGAPICCNNGYVCCGTGHCCPTAACCNSQTGTCFTSSSPTNCAQQTC